MANFPTSRETRKGYWLEPKATIPALVHPDGLLVDFLMTDAQAAMDAKYPHRTRREFGELQKVWYFNSTLDRECAEQDGDRIVANPSVMYELFWSAS